MMISSIRGIFEAKGSRLIDRVATNILLRDINRNG
jgi:hypothetical protein